MAQATGKGQAVGEVLTAVDAIDEGLSLLAEEVAANQNHATRLAGEAPPEDQAGMHVARPYEGGQMEAIENQLLSLLRTLRYANERLSTVTQ